MKLIPSSRRGALWRFALGGLIVIAFTATTTAVAGLLQFKQAVTYLSATPALPHAQVTIANPGDPQTLLLIGSDHRAGTPWKTANTDTMLLVRIDPNSSTINLLSLPRDLKAQIPGHGTEKLNEAYSLGGPNLLLRTIRNNAFPQLKVFGEHTQTDRNLHTTDGLINLFNLVAFSAGHQIKQIPFPAILLPCGPAAPPVPGFAAPPQAACYVGANPGAEQATYRQFM